MHSVFLLTFSLLRDGTKFPAAKPEEWFDRVLHQQTAEGSILAPGERVQTGNVHSGRHVKLCLEA